MTLTYPSRSMTLSNSTPRFALFSASVSETGQAQEMANKSGQKVTEMTFTIVPSLPICIVSSQINVEKEAREMEL